MGVSSILPILLLIWAFEDGKLQAKISRVDDAHAEMLNDDIILGMLNGNRKTGNRF